MLQDLPFPGLVGGWRLSPVKGPVFLAGRSFGSDRARSVRATSTSSGSGVAGCVFAIGDQTYQGVFVLFQNVCQMQSTASCAFL